MRGQIFDLAIAQRADIRLALPSGEGAYPILAQREDGVARTGIVLATKKAQVHRLPAHAKHKARPLNLDLERRLTVVSPLVERPSDRTIPLDLTGSHAGYKWGLNEKTFDPNDPLIVVEGERVEVILRNKTAMPHPIHLHGHHFQVVAVDGGRFSGAIRDTVLVPPRRSVTIAFDADNPGHWAFHCHQLYHMAAGMMTSVRYEGYERSDG
jgi:FtsP/CotA-like multicopper oxidase with cupredoxin domain